MCHQFLLKQFISTAPGNRLNVALNGKNFRGAHCRLYKYRYHRLSGLPTTKVIQQYQIVSTAVTNSLKWTFPGGKTFHHQGNCQLDRADYSELCTTGLGVLLVNDEWEKNIFYSQQNEVI